MVDWTAYRKCMHCFAETGSACTDKTGTRLVNGRPEHVVVTRALPHRGRKARTGR